MKSLIIKIFSLFFLLLLNINLQAQHFVDIGVFTGDNNTLQIKLKPHADFEGLVSNIQFTLKWSVESNANLGDIIQSALEQAYIPMMKSGEVKVHNGYNYQVFTGFGMMPMQAQGQSWNANEEVTLMMLPVTGTTLQFEIVNDNWTKDVTHNGDYYVSLAGQDRTGDIYKSETPTGILESATGYFINVSPNPNIGLFNLETSFLVMNDYEIKVTNMLGQVVYRDELKYFSGKYTQEFSLKKFGTGMYQLTISGNGEQSVKKIVYN